MKVLALNGSPRTSQGATDLITRSFLKGAEEAGAEVETIYLAFAYPIVSATSRA